MDGRDSSSDMEENTGLMTSHTEQCQLTSRTHNYATNDTDTEVPEIQTSSSPASVAVMNEVELDDAVSDHTTASSSTMTTTSKPHPEPPFRGAGLILAIMSGLFFSLMTLCAKMTEHVHAFEIAGVRQFFLMLSVCPVLIYKKQKFFGNKGDRLKLWLRSFLGISNATLVFLAIQHMPIADASVIVFSSPIFVGIFSCICLKEKCGLFEVVITILSFTGVILIARPTYLFKTDDSGNQLGSTVKSHLLGVVFAISAAVVSSITFIIIRKLSHVHYATNIFVFGLWGTIQCTVLTIAFQVYSLPSCNSRLYLLGVAFCCFLAQLCLVHALKYENAGPVSICRSLEIVFAFLWQYLFLDEHPTLFSIFGAVLVILCVIFLGVKKQVAFMKQNDKIKTSNKCMSCLVVCTEK